jgi:hypothetical protein
MPLTFETVVVFYSKCIVALSIVAFSSECIRVNVLEHVTE